MFAKIKQNVLAIYTRRNELKDIRVFGQIVFVVIVLLVSWSGVKAIQSNYALQKQIATLTAENQVQKLANANLQLQNEYYNSNQYLELSARENLGLGAPGETELLVPTSVALKQLIITSPKITTAKAIGHQSTIGKNFQSWIDFIFHRQTSPI